MEVTPKILRNGKITLNLKISQNMPGMAIKRGDSEALLIDKQEIKTQITVNDGETIVLGGFSSKKIARELIKCPYWPISLGWERCSNKTPNNKVGGS